ncbi:hypothetical protein [Sphingomonas sp. CARO-RG-8B-R24-01]|nr:hypothetical protein [Sphingomonas sp. CARO-RG-8B-R24-01]
MLSTDTPPSALAATSTRATNSQSLLPDIRPPFVFTSIRVDPATRS